MVDDDDDLMSPPPIQYCDHQGRPLTRRKPRKLQRRSALRSAHDGFLPSIQHVTSSEVSQLNHVAELDSSSLLDDYSSILGDDEDVPFLSTTPPSNQPLESLMSTSPCSLSLGQLKPARHNKVLSTLPLPTATLDDGSSSGSDTDVDDETAPFPLKKAGTWPRYSEQSFPTVIKIPSQSNQIAEVETPLRQLALKNSTSRGLSKSCADFSLLPSPSSASLSQQLDTSKNASSSTNVLNGSFEEMPHASEITSSPTMTRKRFGSDISSRSTANFSYQFPESRTASATMRSVNRQDCRLPVVRGSHPDLNCISAHTVSALMCKDAPLRQMFSNVYVIDCRYPYEFDGGHIRNALNIPNEQNLIERFFSTQSLSALRANRKPVAVIFHCEFSSQRGPRSYRTFRNQDRKLNQHNYPNLHYPELYLLEGGYKQFFHECKTQCEPQAYIEMKHPDYLRQFKEFRRHLSNIKATNSSSRRRRSSMLSASSDFGAFPRPQTHRPSVRKPSFDALRSRSLSISDFSKIDSAQNVARNRKQKNGKRSSRLTISRKRASTKIQRSATSNEWYC
mmetsp:Transcript_19334/g.28810  ORF Transcript_19334/g.28810 Transcript_19334/m.28810 type:complete len:563 (-) Transcript_19334:12-1700(-)